MTEPIPSEIFKLLPVYLQNEAKPGSFLELLVTVWEHIMIKKPAEIQHLALKQILHQTWRYFAIEQETPEEFIDWLAAKLGLFIQSDWTRTQKKILLAQAMTFYRKRGTKQALRGVLNLYVAGDIEARNVRIIESPGVQIGIYSVVGVSTIIEGVDCFAVKVRLPSIPLPEVLCKKKQALSELIDREKPVHTRYGIKLHVPTMRIGVSSRIAVDTLLW